MASLLRHPGLAEAAEIGGFEQRPSLRGPPPTWIGLQMGDARKKIAAVQPPGLGEFGHSTFGFASEGIGGGETAARERCGWHDAARFFEPDDCLVGARLQQMHVPNQMVERADAGIARAEANGLLDQRDHLLYRPDGELAPAEME